MQECSSISYDNISIPIKMKRTCLCVKSYFTQQISGTEIIHLPFYSFINYFFPLVRLLFICVFVYYRSALSIVTSLLPVIHLKIRLLLSLTRVNVTACCYSLDFISTGAKYN